MMKLCYIEESWAYFTHAPLTGKDCQFGDDWNDAPYEHNAGEPYGDNILKLAWEGPFDAPCSHHTNSPYSVERINQGVIPWLVTSKWSDGPVVTIFAGTSPEEFVQKIKEGGGNVYEKI